MTESQPQFIDVSRLRVGMFIHLDLGWMQHPFSLNSFKVQSREQIDIIRSLGIERVRYSPEKSDPEPSTTLQTAAAAVEEKSPEMAGKRRRRDLLSSQRASLLVCERQFAGATQTFKLLADSVHAQPVSCRERSEALINGFIGEILGKEEACIRLLSEKAGEKTAHHSINVTVISLLLGKASGLAEQELEDLGMGALLHDIGKIELPDRLRWKGEHFTTAERQIFQEHVAHGVNLGKKMGLSKEALLIIGQHHEHADGSGYPLHIMDDKMSLQSRIVSLVNRYDNLCNPVHPALAVTPHEALSMMFAQMKALFHGPTMSLFIRMMGVYPPGSVVQLTDERYALVVSVNSSRPLKPRVVVHDPHVPRDEALVVDLEDERDLGIRRSLKPLQLPRATFDYLSPRKRMCYFFERARETPGECP